MPPASVHTALGARLFLVVTLLGLAVTTAFPQLDRKWYLLYDEGLKAIEDGEYEKAIEKLDLAIGQKSKPSANARFYGDLSGPYLPHFYLGLAYFKLGKYEDARMNFEREQRYGAIQKVPPQKAELDRLLGQVKEKLAETLKASPEDRAAFERYQRAYELYRAGRPAEAVPVLEKLRAENVSCAPDAERLLREIRAAEALNRETDVLYKQAEAAFATGDFDAAATGYREVLNRRPDYPNLVERIGRCDRAIRLKAKRDKALGLASTDPATAEILLKDIREEDPAFTGTDELARQVEAGKAKAAETLKALGAGGPAASDEARKALAAVQEYQRAYEFYNQGKFDPARSLLEPLRTKGGEVAGKAEALLTQIQSAEELGRATETAFQAAEGLYAKGEYAKASQAYREVQEKRPDYPGLLESLNRCNRALRLSKLLEKARALAASAPGDAAVLLRSIREEDPAFPGLEALAAQVERERKKQDQAATQSSKAQEAYDQAQNLFRQKRYAEARSALEKVRANPGALKAKIEDLLKKIEVEENLARRRRHST